MSDATKVKNALRDAAMTANAAAIALLKRMNSEVDPDKAEAIREKWEEALAVRDEADAAYQNSAFKTAGGTSLENATARLKDRIQKLEAEQARWEEVAAVVNALSVAIKGVLLVI